MKHKLKTWPEFYKQVVLGNKKFEVRKNDRDFKEGDYLLLQEYDPINQKYSGRDTLALVTYVLYGNDSKAFGIEPGNVVMSIRLMDRTQL